MLQNNGLIPYQLYEDLLSASPFKFRTHSLQWSISWFSASLGRFSGVTMRISLLLVLLTIAVTSAAVVRRNGNQSQKCYSKPQKFKDSKNRCIKNLSTAAKILFLVNPDDELREIKCLPLCVLKGINWFQNGRLSIENIRSSIRESIPDREMAEELRETYEEYARRVNRMDADDCTKGQEFHRLEKSRSNQESRTNQNKKFCKTRKGRSSYLAF